MAEFRARYGNGFDSMNLRGIISVFRLLQLPRKAYLCVNLAAYYEFDSWIGLPSVDTVEYIFRFLLPSSLCFECKFESQFLMNLVLGL